MRILVYGAGVLGCNLASNLYCAKKDVTLLARGAWAEEFDEAAFEKSVKTMTSLPDGSLELQRHDQEQVDVCIVGLKPGLNDIKSGIFTQRSGYGILACKVCVYVPIDPGVIVRFLKSCKADQDCHQSDIKYCQLL